MASFAELRMIFLTVALLLSQIEARASPYERTRYNQQEGEPEFYRESGSGYGLVDKAKDREQVDAQPQHFSSYKPSTATPATRPEEYNTGNYQNPESNPTEVHEMPPQFANRYPTSESYRTGYPVHRVRESHGENNRVAEMSARQGMSDTRYFSNGEFYYDPQGVNHGNAYAFHSLNRGTSNQIKPSRYFADEWDDEELP